MLEAELVSKLNELAAMPPEHMLGWTVLILGSPVAAWLGWVMDR